MLLSCQGSDQAVAHPLPVICPTHTHSATANRKGRLSDLLQEKASPRRDPAVENLLESTKDWSDYGDHRGWKRRKKNGGISKRKQYSQANPGPEQNSWSWKEGCSGKSSRGGLGPGPRRVNTNEQMR